MAYGLTYNKEKKTQLLQAHFFHIYISENIGRVNPSDRECVVSEVPLSCRTRDIIIILSLSGIHD